MSENTRLYVTKGVVDEEFLREANMQVMRPRYQRITLRVCGVIIGACLLLMVVMGFATGEWDIAARAIVQMLLIIGALCAFVGFIRKFAGDQSVKRFQEETPGGKAEYVVAFDENGVHVYNGASGAKVAFSYTSFKRLMQVKENWALLTKSNAIVPVFAGTLSKTDRKSVLALLKEKNPKIRIDLKEKL